MSKANAAAAAAAAAAAPVQPISVVTAVACRVYILAIPEAKIGGDLDGIRIKAARLNLAAMRPFCADGADGTGLDTIEKVCTVGSKYLKQQGNGVALTEEGEFLGEKWLPTTARIPYKAGEEMSVEDMMAILKRTAAVSSCAVPDGAPTKRPAEGAHYNQAYSTFDALRVECPWRRFPPGASIQVAPCDAHNIPKHVVALDKVPLEHILVTRAMRFSRLSELGLGMRAKHCNDFCLDDKQYGGVDRPGGFRYEGTCARGAECFFIHAVCTKHKRYRGDGTFFDPSNPKESPHSGGAAVIMGAQNKNNNAQSSSSAAAGAASSNNSTPVSPVNTKKDAPSKALSSREGSDMLLQGGNNNNNDAAKKNGQSLLNLLKGSRDGSSAADDFVGGTPVSNSNGTSGSGLQAAPAPKLSVKEKKKAAAAAAAAAVTSAAPPQQQQQQQQAGGADEPSLSLVEALLCRISYLEVRDETVPVDALEEREYPRLLRDPYFAGEAAQWAAFLDALYHLEDEGLVEYDADADTVSPTEAAVARLKKIYKRLNVPMRAVMEMDRRVDVIEFLDVLLKRGPSSSSPSAPPQVAPAAPAAKKAKKSAAAAAPTVAAAAPVVAPAAITAPKRAEQFAADASAAMDQQWSLAALSAGSVPLGVAADFGAGVGSGIGRAGSGMSDGDELVLRPQQPRVSDDLFFDAGAAAAAAPLIDTNTLLFGGTSTFSSAPPPRNTSLGDLNGLGGGNNNNNSNKHELDWGRGNDNHVHHHHHQQQQQHQNHQQIDALHAEIDRLKAELQHERQANADLNRHLAEAKMQHARAEKDCIELRRQMKTKNAELRNSLLQCQELLDM